MKFQSLPTPWCSSLAQPPLCPQRKGLVTLASKIYSLLPKTGNIYQITVFVFYDVCFGITMGTMDLCNKCKSLSQR